MDTSELVNVLFVMLIAAFCMGAIQVGVFICFIPRQDRQVAIPRSYHAIRERVSVVRMRSTGILFGLVQAEVFTIVMAAIALAGQYFSLLPIFGLVNIFLIGFACHVAIDWRNDVAFLLNALDEPATRMAPPPTSGTEAA